MKINSFDDSPLTYRKFALSIEEFIRNNRPFVDGSVVLALSSPFGSGKTTFFNSWKTEIDNRSDDSNKILVVQLNALECDYFGDPLFALVSGLAECLIKKESKNRLVEAAKDIGEFTMGMANQIVKKLSGVDVVAAGKHADEKKDRRAQRPDLMPDSFSIYEGRKKAMHSLKMAISEAIEDSQALVLFLIDELDRCRPDFAVSYLETIKHIFDVDGAAFVLAADRDHLENSAKKAFGDDLNFNEYYRKFVHHEISFPELTADDYRQIATFYLNYYIIRNGVRNTVIKDSQQAVKNIVELMTAFQLQPRQIQEVFRILGHVFSIADNRTSQYSWCEEAAYIAMAIFKVAGDSAYESLGQGKFEVKSAITFLRNRLKPKAAVWWFNLFLAGHGLNVDVEDYGEIAQASYPKFIVGENAEARMSIRDHDKLQTQGFDGFAQFDLDWETRAGEDFHKIYDKINGLLKWTDKI